MSSCTTTLDRDPGRHRHDVDERRHGRRIGGMVTGFLVAASLTGTVAYVLITATAANPAPETVTSGTLSLTLATNGTGFSQAIANLMPADVVNRYVTLTNGAVDATGLTLGVSATSATKLSTDATTGLQIAVTSCSVAWTSGSCPGTPQTLVASAPLATFGTKTLISGAVPANSVQYLQLTVTLPNQNETTTNGAPPTNSVQGLSTGLTWTFTETQRAGVTTSS